MTTKTENLKKKWICAFKRSKNNINLYTFLSDCSVQSYGLHSSQNIEYYFPNHKGSQETPTVVAAGEINSFIILRF